MAVHHPVDDDPEMASAIGRCSNCWTHLETNLARIFSTLTETHYAIAVTVFSFFKATRTQRDVLKKLGAMSPFMTDELNNKLKEVLKSYLVVAERRNELLHNPIGRSIENQVYVMLRSKTPAVGDLPYYTRPISPAEIDGITSEIKSVHTTLLQLSDDISAARFPPNKTRDFFDSLMKQT